MFKNYFERCSQIGVIWFMNSKSALKQKLTGQSKRDDLRRRLLDVTTARIEKAGLLSLRARDVTQDAGCALGALYTAFEDLDGLILAVNAQTLQALDQQMEQAISSQGDAGQRLRVLGQTYLAFALAHEKLWRALFEHKFPDNRPLPEWLMANQVQLLSRIASPLADLLPDFNEQELLLRTRTMFAAVHGIVSISLDNRFVGLPTDTLGHEVDNFILLLLAGLLVSKNEIAEASPAPIPQL